ncbi:hypothetical protein ACIOHS_27035 [Streptomyces sp. NPDC088253]|uniref:hypothetical protein n=1 Tax=Streptomyces sp. NPDC088253 TaxID=3365846 RepID=UPI0038301CA9
MTHLTRLRALVPDWPEPPASASPVLTLTWWDAVRLPADKFTGAIVDSVLQADGAIAPVATVEWAPVTGARNGRGWLWRCRVYVVGAPAVRANPMDFDCREAWRSTTRDGARDAAAEHVRTAHPDATVMCDARCAQAARVWK